jgi:hypothetical protein
MFWKYHKCGDKICDRHESCSITNVVIIFVIGTVLASRVFIVRHEVWSLRFPFGIFVTIQVVAGGCTLASSV